MVVLGIDAHKRSHTVVVIDEVGRQLAAKTLGTTTANHVRLLRWAEQFGEPRRRDAGPDARREHQGRRPVAAGSRRGLGRLRRRRQPPALMS
jgi:hypothetical protein